MPDPVGSFGRTDGDESGRPARRSGTRKAISAELPEAVQALLLDLERLADGNRFSFPQMTKLIHQDGGERLNAANITRWRNGGEFPSEDAVRRWVRLCSGDEAAAVRKYALANAAYLRWKANRRQPATAAAPPGRQRRRPLKWIAAGAVGVLSLAATAIWLWPEGDIRSRAGIAVGPCQWRSREVPAAIRTTPPEALLYKVPSGEGSRDVPILGGGAMLQPFVATTPRIGKAAAIIGLDDARTDVTRPHPVRFEIVDPASDAVLGQQPTEVTPDNVNKDVVASFAPPVPVEVDGIYVLRVVNTSTSTIGFYVNRREGPDRLVPYPEDVCVENPVGPFTTTGWSMAGLIGGAA